MSATVVWSHLPSARASRRTRPPSLRGWMLRAAPAFFHQGWTRNGARTATGAPSIGVRYAFSEMNDRWFGWKNLMSNDRTDV